MLKIQTALLLASVLFSAGNQVGAQQPAAQPQQGQKNNRPPIKKNDPHPTNEFDTNILTTMPPMPLLPEYTGKGFKLVNALTYPNFKFGKCYTVRINAKEPASVIHEWYLSALPASGWRLNTEQVDATTIVAKHTKQLASCTIVVQPSGASDFRTEIMIRYIDQSAR